MRYTEDEGQSVAGVITGGAEGNDTGHGGDSGDTSSGGLYS